MPRQARIDYNGAYHHIISRGFKKENLFNTPQDYIYYLNCLKEYSKYGYKILEYCLMPNHIHLLLQTGEIPLQKILKSINTKFAIYAVKKRQRPGPIFQGRPKSILIVGEEHLKVVSRYILRNPLNANLTHKLIDYKWSSYSLLMSSTIPDWYDNKIILSMFSNNMAESIKRYIEYIRKPLKQDDAEYPLETFGGIAAGDKIIFERILKNLGIERRKSKKTYTRKIDWEERVKKIIENSGQTIEEIRKRNSKKNIEIKKRIAYIMKELMFYESKQIMKYLNVKKSSLSRYIADIKNRTEKKELTEGIL